MKKLMIAATVAAMTVGAYAGACDDVDLTENCLVYDVTFKVKTLTPKQAVCKDSGKCSDECEVVYYLSDTSRTFNGYLWFCNDDCWDVTDTPYIALWDKKAQTAIIPLYWDYNDKKTAKVAYPTETEFEFLGRYSKKADKVAAMWTVVTEFGDISAAGVKGSVMKDKEWGTVTLKSISGNAVGYTYAATIKGSKCHDDEWILGKIAALCDCWDTWCEDGDDIDVVPFTGTWSLKYNKKLSLGGKSMLELVPSYAQIQE